MVVAFYSDEPLLVAGLMGMAKESAFEVRETFSSIRELLSCLSKGATPPPDVILLDDTPELTFHSIAQIRSVAAGAKLVLWARDVSPETAQHLLDAGVTGILRKNLSRKMVQLCIEKVAAGEIWIERALVESLLLGRKVTLSRRERQLLRLVSCGLSNKQIAEELFLSEGTVKVYLSRLFRKTGVQDRLELAIFGLRNSRFPPGISMGDKAREDPGWPTVFVLPQESGTDVA